MGQVLSDAELLRHKSPVLVESFEFPNEVREHIAIRINKPIQLVAMRGGVNTSRAAVLDPVDELFEGHFVSELDSFRALIEGNGAVPGVTNKSELEVGLELLSPDFSPALFRKHHIERRQNPVLSSAIARPISFHLVFDLPQVEMRFPCFAENGPNAGRAGLGYLYENAFVLVRDHA